MNPTKAFTSLDDWLAWLESLSPREIVLGLDRVREVLERLDIERPALVINVAGTNGKGSSVAILESLLRQGGIRTGCYTSPHLRHYNERTRIDGTPASDEQMIAALEKVEAARGEVPLTYFEFGTVATLVAFDAAGVEAWILEVGMGGRLDAVNAIEPDGCLITNVSLDHCAWLGDDIESIAREKAGIMRASKPVIYGSETVPRAITAIAAETGADLSLAGEDFAYEPVPDERWNWRGRQMELQGIAQPALAGPSQLRNAAAVLALIEAMGRDELLQSADVSKALASIELEGRFQRVGDRWILDVAHNPEAARVLADLIRDLQGTGKVTAIVGMLTDKDVAGFVSPLGECVDSFVAVSVSASRGESAEKLSREIANASGRPCLIQDDLHEALRHAEKHAGEDDLIVVTGSFYIVGPALEWLHGN